MSQAPALDRLTVVIVTYHSAHCLAELGRCLSEFPHVVVVDNASTDDTGQLVARHLPQARCVINPRNLGFGGANNRGIASAHTDWVLLLNPDCLMDASAACALIASADAYPNAAMVGPQLIDRRGHLDEGYSWTPGTWSAKGPLASGPACVGFISGACMLIKRDAMLKIGGFDEAFFLYYEDTDLCLRLAKEAGPLILEPAAKVTHISRGSSGGKARFKAEYLRGYHHIQSKYLFQAKHQGMRVSALRRWRYSAVAALECLIRCLLLDGGRAARVAGRFMGSLRYEARQVPLG